MSFRSKLSSFWNNIHDFFSDAEKNIGELSQQHKDFIALLDLIRIEEFVPNKHWNRGRPSKHGASIARAFIAKMFFKIPTTKQLVDYLKVDNQLASICGWHFKFIPSEATFSRAFAEFAEIGLPEKVHQALIENVYKDEVVGHVTKDSTPIEAREKHIKKEDVKQRVKLKNAKRTKKKAGELNRRQKQLQEPNLDKMMQDLPRECDKGMKKSARGYTMVWRGWKLHAAVDDHCVPLAAIVTSASLNDCEAAIPLAIKCNNVVTSLYDLMDAAYDHPEIKEHSRSLGHIPIIDKCPHGVKQKQEKEDEAQRKKLLKFYTAEDLRYKERLKTERFNALYKDNYGGRNLRVRGFEKASCEIMFGVLALAANLILNLAI
jgi:hypothetical protein